MKNHNIIKFLLYDADLRNKSKISVYWVELLKIKFWFQGNKEKIEFTYYFFCYRVDYDILSSLIQFLLMLNLFLIFFSQ